MCTEWWSSCLKEPGRRSASRSHLHPQRKRSHAPLSLPRPSFCSRRYQMRHPVQAPNLLAPHHHAPVILLEVLSAGPCVRRNHGLLGYSTPNALTMDQSTWMSELSLKSTQYNHELQKTYVCQNVGLIKIKAPTLCEAYDSGKNVHNPIIDGNTGL